MKLRGIFSPADRIIKFYLQTSSLSEIYPEYLLALCLCRQVIFNGFKLKEGIRTRHEEQIFYSKGGETLELVTQRGYRCPIPGKFYSKSSNTIKVMVFT